jgi:hypothetical protein
MSDLTLGSIGAAVPSPSALMYLFRDRLSPAPADDKTLAELLMAVAVWALADQDVIDLGPLEHPRPVDGHLGFNRKRAYAEQPGLEGGLLRSMAGKGKEQRQLSVVALLTIGLPIGFETEARHDSVRHAIESGPWITRRTYRAVIHECVREARGAGALSRLGKRPKADAIASLELPFSELQSRWARFASQHAELHGALTKDCADGLAARD